MLFWKVCDATTKSSCEGEASMTKALRLGAILVVAFAAMLAPASNPLPTSTGKNASGPH